ncbi:hypothetical protein EDC96DRAFT_443226, partial [Choanephora cucurbitarum]
HNADGIVRFKAMNDVELPVLEVFVCLKSTIGCKIGFDNVKGILALLSILKRTSNMYSFATMKTIR